VKHLIENFSAHLCVLCVSAVRKCVPDLYCGDAENAEIAQRRRQKIIVSKKGTAGESRR